MATIRELVIANCITLGIVVVFVTCVSLEVKREFFIDGRTSASYKFKLF
jgi:Na+/H+ antiporter NhaA